VTCGLKNDALGSVAQSNGGRTKGLLWEASERGVARKIVRVGCKVEGTSPNETKEGKPKEGERRYCPKEAERRKKQTFLLWGKKGIGSQPIAGETWFTRNDGKGVAVGQKRLRGGVGGGHGKSNTTII